MTEDQLYDIWEERNEDRVNEEFSNAGFVSDQFGTQAHCDFFHQKFEDEKEDFRDIIIQEEVNNKKTVNDYNAQVEADYKKSQTGDY